MNSGTNDLARNTCLWLVETGGIISHALFFFRVLSGEKTVVIPFGYDRYKKMNHCIN